MTGVQTCALPISAAHYASQAADNKVSVTSVPDGNGGATIIYADKATDKEVNRITVTSAVVDEYLKKKGGTGGTTPPPGERPPLTSFSGNTTAPAPVATATTPSAPMAASNTTVSLYDQNTRTYKLTQDPEYLQIAQLAASNQQRLETDPAFQAQIQQAMNQLKAKRQAELGSFVQFQ